MRAIAAVLPAVSNTASAVGAKRSIDTEIAADAPVATVRQAWTTRGGIVGFFAPDAGIDARPDVAFRNFVDPHAPAGSQGAVLGDLRRHDAPDGVPHDRTAWVQQMREATPRASPPAR